MCGRSVWLSALAFICLSALVTALSSALPSQAWARLSQITIRTGPMYGSYSGPLKGHFFVPNSLDMQYSSFLTTDRTLNFRATLDMQLPSAIPDYIYAGTGMTFYHDSKGMWFDRSEGNTSISVTPTRRYYWGFDVGIAEALIQSYGTVLQAVSVMFDAGPYVGETFQVNKQWGVDLLAGASMDYGFSSIGVVGYTIRALAGVTYSF